MKLLVVGLDLAKRPIGSWYMAHCGLSDRPAEPEPTGLLTKSGHRVTSSTSSQSRVTVTLALKIVPSHESHIDILFIHLYFQTRRGFRPSYPLGCFLLLLLYR